jgi:hypothetical protein
MPKTVSQRRQVHHGRLSRAHHRGEEELPLQKIVPVAMQYPRLQMVADVWDDGGSRWCQAVGTRISQPARWPCNDRTAARRYGCISAWRFGRRCTQGDSASDRLER